MRSCYRCNYPSRLRGDGRVRCRLPNLRAFAWLCFFLLLGRAAVAGVPAGKAGLNVVHVGNTHSCPLRPLIPLASEAAAPVSLR